MTDHARHALSLPSLVAMTVATGLLGVPALAEKIYKTIDAEGNVSFSSTPPPAGAQSQEIELSPGPSRAQQRQSVKAEQQLENQSDEQYQEVVDDSSAEVPEQPEESSDMEDQQDVVGGGDDSDPVYVDGDYVDDERARDRVEDVRDAAPVRGEVHRPAGRVR